jgi:hypothetical protein
VFISSRYAGGTLESLQDHLNDMLPHFNSGSRIAADRPEGWKGAHLR